MLLTCISACSCVTNAELLAPSVPAWSIIPAWTLPVTTSLFTYHFVVIAAATPSKSTRFIHSPTVNLHPMALEEVPRVLHSKPRWIRLSSNNLQACTSTNFINSSEPHRMWSFLESIMAVTRPSNQKWDRQQQTEDQFSQNPTELSIVSGEVTSYCQEKKKAFVTSSFTACTSRSVQWQT